MPTDIQALKTTIPRFEVELATAPTDPSAHTISIYRDEPTPITLLGRASHSGTNTRLWILDPPGSALPIGANKLRVESKCGAGQNSVYDVRISVFVDLTAPVTQIVTAPGPQTKEANATFTFKTTNESRESSFKCKLDSGPEESCGDGVQNNTTSSKSYGPLPEGTYTFSVYAIDAAGNPGTPVPYTWTVDQTPPDTVITQKPDPVSGQPQAVFKFEGAGTGGKFYCRLGTGALEECSTGSKTYSGLTSGNYTFAVYAQDAARNDDADPATYSWVVDVTPPVAEIKNKPVNPTNQASAAFTYSSTETGSTFFCRLDQGGYSLCDPTGKTYTALTESAHTFCVYAQDSLGNKGDQSPACYTWTVDVTPPITVIDTKPNNPTNQTSTSFTFSGGGTNGKYYCKLDEGIYEECSSGSQPYSDLTERVHTFCVYGQDEAGNVDATPACHTWVLDLTPPDTSIDDASKPRNPTNVTSVTFRFTGAGVGGGYRCKLDEGTEEPCSSGSVTYSNLSERVHTFTVYAVDAAGNADSQAPATYSWQVDITKPETTILDPKPTNPSSASTVTFRFTGADLGGKYYCSLDSAPYTQCNSGSVTVTVGTGPHNFSVYAEDAAGNVDSTPDTHPWTVDLSIPDTKIDPASEPPSPTNATTATFRFSGAGAGGRYRCTLNAGAEEPCDSGVKTYTSLGERLHTFCVYAVNAAGTRDPDAECHDWTVDVTPPDTVIEPASKPRNPTNVTSVTFKFTNLGGASKYLCTLDSLPQARCDNGTFTATVGQGPHTFSVYAQDEAGNSDPSPAVHPWFVDLTPPETLITDRPPNPSKERDATFKFSSGETGGKYWCSIDSGAEEGCDSGSKVYTNLAEVPHTFCVYAVDAAENKELAAVCYTWRVDVSAPNTVIDSVSERNPTNSTRITFRFGGAGPGEGYRCKLDNGQKEDCNSGEKTYTGLLEGQHTFSVAAVDVAGNEDPTPATHSWYVDLTLPVIVVTGPTPRQRIKTPAPQFSGTSEPNTEIVVSITVDSVTSTATALTNSEGVWTLATSLDLPDRMHTAIITAKDLAGNPEREQAVVEFFVDTLEPETKCVSGPREIDNSRRAVFVFDAPTEPLEDTSFECTVQEVASGRQVDARCSTSELTVNIATLFEKENVNGVYLLRASARDEAGNVDSSPCEHRWTVVVDPPGPPEIVDPPNGAVVYNLRPTILGTATAKGTVDVFLDGTKVGPAQVNEEGKWSFAFTEDLPEGTYALNGIATDQASNPSVESEPITIIVRTPRPPAQAIGGGFGCAASGLQPGLALLGLIAGAVWNSRRRRR